MQSDSLKVVQVKDGYLSVRAIKDIPSGSFLSDIWGPVINSPNMYTIQVNKGKHVFPEGPTKLTNHSCQPNAKIVFEKRNAMVPTSSPHYEVFWQLFASRDIKKGEDITFDYTTTEYEMAESFQCNCGEAKCLGEIKGFKFLSPEQKRQKANHASPAIKSLYKNEM